MFHFPPTAFIQTEPDDDGLEVVSIWHNGRLIVADSVELLAAAMLPDTLAPSPQPTPCAS